MNLPRYRLLQVFAYGSVISTYILILLGGYVTTSDSGLGCGESWPLCKNAVLPALSDQHLVNEFAHRLFNLVVGVFILGTAVIAWTKYRQSTYVLIFSSASFVGLLAQVILGMVTVQTGLDPLAREAHLGLASAVFGLIIVDAVMVWILKNGLKTQTVIASRISTI